MNDLVYIGYITGPFGLKGELKVLSESNHLDKIFKEGNILYIDNNKYVLKKYHFHKNHLLTFDGYEDINKINDLLKKDIYISRSNLNLEDGEYLYIDLLGCQILADGQSFGVVEELLSNKNTIFLKSGNLIVPINEKYIEKVDTKEKIVYGKSIKELQL